MEAAKRNCQELSVAAALTELAQPNIKGLVASRPAQTAIASLDQQSPHNLPISIPKSKGIQTKISFKSDSMGKMSFAQILFEIVDNPCHKDIITWLPDGKSWIIVDKKRFASDILPKYFKQSQFPSFTRRLVRWKFNRVSRGTWMGAYHHEFFRRDRKYLCMFMTCSNEPPNLRAIAAKVRFSSRFSNRDSTSATPQAVAERPEHQANVLASLEEMNISIMKRQLLDLRRRKARIQEENAQMLMNIQANTINSNTIQWVQQELDRITYLKRLNGASSRMLQPDAAVTFNAMSPIMTSLSYRPEILCAFQQQQQQQQQQRSPQVPQFPQLMNMPFVAKTNKELLLAQSMLNSVQIPLPFTQKQRRSSNFRASAA